METRESSDPKGGAEANSESRRAQTKARPFDFRHPVFLSSPQWRKLRIEVEEFVESLGALLSTYLRLDFGLQLGGLETIHFNEFTSRLSSPTHLVLFKLEPLRGISVFEIRPPLGLAIVDRLLGGPGAAATLDRNLTEMEIALLDQFAQITLGEWAKQLSKLQELRPEILGHENNGKFLQSSSGETVMLVIALEARIGECVDRMQLAFPYLSLELLVQKLGTGSPAPQAKSLVPPPNAGVKWNPALDALPLNLNAHWPEITTTARAMLALKVGDLIELRPEDAEQLELRAGKIVKFKGRLGTRENRRAIQITEVRKP